MSAFVLNRNYELQLPNNFVDIDRDEMEYVDGGATYLGTLSTTTCNRISAWLAFGAGLAAVAGSIITLVALYYSRGMAAAVVGGIAAGVVGTIATASGYFWVASAYNGMKVYSDGSLRINW